MKLAVLHVDQAVELVLKEKVRTLGQSIYKNPKETITIWGAYDILKESKVNVPEKPDLEMLHEERNNIQHKFSNPSLEDTAFYLEKAVGFIKRFCSSELGVTIDSFVSGSYVDDILSPKKP